MAVCSKCGASYAYTEPHICEGRDTAKLWTLAWIVGIVAIGAVIGGPLGLVYARSLSAQACDQPTANNLCGVPTALFAVPFYGAIGAVLGASVAGCVVVVILRRRQA